MSDSEHAKQKAYQLASLEEWRKDPSNDAEDLAIIKRQIEWCNDASSPYGDLVGWMRCARNACDSPESLHRLRDAYSRLLEQIPEYGYSDLIESYTAKIEDVDIRMHIESRIADVVKRGGAQMLCAHSDDCE